MLMVRLKRWGRNSRLDNIQAVILSYKLKVIQMLLNEEEIAQIYQDRLETLE